MGIECVMCGEPTERGRQTCSAPCFTELRRKITTKEQPPPGLCVVCGNTCPPIRWWNPPRQTCSSACKHKLIVRKRVERGYKPVIKYPGGKKSDCQYCGTPFLLKSHATTKYCSLKCAGLGQPRGANSRAWRGGRTNCAGYVLIYTPGHPGATKSHYVREHRLVMEKHLGRYLVKGERVHHLNGIRDDNRIENLQLLNDLVDHKHLSCPSCGHWFNPAQTIMV